MYILIDGCKEFIYFMHRKRRFKSDRSWPYDAIKHQLGSKIDNIDEVIKYLLDLGILHRVKKKGTWRYWIDLGESKKILKEYGYNV